VDRASKGDRPLFVELDTDIRGACVFLAALAEVNVLDCLRRPELRADLFDRLGRPDGFKYRVEQPDTWTAFSVDYWRKEQMRKGRRAPRTYACASRACQEAEERAYTDVIGCDCEEIASFVAASGCLLGLSSEVVITQPKEKGVAHAYARVDGQIRDACVFYGMRPPPPEIFQYLGPETVILPVQVPEFSLHVPRENERSSSQEPEETSA